MPATFTCASVRPNNGIQQVHLTLDRGQQNDLLFNITSEVLSMLFNADVRGADVQGGDTWELSAKLISRAGTNGTSPSPLSQKT